MSALEDPNVIEGEEAESSDEESSEDEAPSAIGGAPSEPESSETNPEGVVEDSAELGADDVDENIECVSFDTMSDRSHCNGTSDRRSKGDNARQQYLCMVDHDSHCGLF
jgi:hypothetical protein